MQVVLTRNVEKLGHRGQVKNVKDGYYSNFLQPRGFAKVATPGLLKWAEKLETESVKAKAEVAEKAVEFKTKLESETYTVESKTSDKDTLYASVGEKEIIALLEGKANVKLDKKQILLDEHIKTVGVHAVKIKLSDSVTAEIKIEVIATQE